MLFTTLLILVFVFGNLECSPILNDLNGELVNFNEIDRNDEALQDDSNALNMLENALFNKLARQPAKKSRSFNFFASPNGRQMVSPSLPPNVILMHNLTKLNQNEITRLLNHLKNNKDLKLDDIKKYLKNLQRIIFSYGR